MDQQFITKWSYKMNVYRAVIGTVGYVVCFSTLLYVGSLGILTFGA